MAKKDKKDKVPSIITPYVKASYPLVYICTPEESRAELECLRASDESGTQANSQRELFTWSMTTGLVDAKDKDAVNDENTMPPVAALMQAKDSENPTIFLFRDLHMQFENPMVLRLLRDIARIFKQKRSTLVISSPVRRLPPEIERDIVVIDLELPEAVDIAKTWDNLYSANETGIGDVSVDERENVIQSALGLTAVEAENAMSKAVIQRKGLIDKIENKELPKDTPIPNISALVMDEKALAVRKSGILEYYKADETVDDIGGLENLKKWMYIRSKAMTKAARDFGLPVPRGAMLAGLPGCGKSLSAKAIAKILGVPLIRFDIGRVFAGLVGQSEANMRTAIQTIEAIGNCVVWVDEAEKAFAGVSARGDNDSGVTKRVFGDFVTWMQEKKTASFIVMTVNAIDGLPPEMMRKGRFDEIFYVGLPDATEREAIFKIHLNKHRPNAKVPSMDKLVKDTKKFSGAEIAETIVSAMYTAFYKIQDDGLDEDKVDDHFEFYIQKAISETNPLATSRAEQLQGMATWAKENAINASKQKSGKEGAGRQLDLDA